MSKTHDGYLLIADITGYTRYLNESELEHAQETLTALLELLVEKTGPPLVISRLAGDAVISYGFRENFFHGQTLIEKVEDTYVVFRKAVERMVRNTTCPCSACANISNLDLKFFVHYGAFGVQRIADHDELVGSDVNLLHRLLKNSVTETTDIRAYALYTEAALGQLGVEAMAQAMTPHSERYEHLGEVKVRIQDMHPIWDEKAATVAVAFPSDRILSRLATDISMPRERVWDYLIQPEYRNSLIGSDRMVVVNHAQGRIAPGSVYQCYHGDKMVPQTIMEWQPFESMIVREVSPMSPSTGSLCEYRLEEIEGGTRLTKAIARPTGPFLGRALMRLLIPVFHGVGERGMEAFNQQIEEDFRARRAASEHQNEVTLKRRL